MSRVIMETLMEDIKESPLEWAAFIFWEVPTGLIKQWFETV